MKDEAPCQDTGSNPVPVKSWQQVALKEIINYKREIYEENLKR